MDKSNHTVTVPREYLEKLENFYQDNIVSSENNVRGVYSKVQDKNFLVLWNVNTNIPADIVLVVDKEGKEKYRFTLDK